MATFIEIANELAKNFVQNSNKREAADRIASYINSLVYSGTNTPLTYSDKETIVRHIGEFIGGVRLFSYREGGRVIIAEKRDNATYLEMVGYVLGQLNTNR
jgi:hypothetical protein